jgi:ferric-dicitrate binding protein FerR (iron transport regulator)
MAWRRSRFRIRRPALLALLCLAGCTTGQGSQREVVGVLGVSGSAVYVNRAPAQSGRMIYSGDEVSTGPASSAIVDFGGGHFLQLDENTDPLFSWRTVDQIRCIFIQMFSGQAYADSSPLCLATPAVDVVSGSRINVRAQPQTAIITLLEGHMTPRRPPGRALAAGEELVVEPGGRLELRRLAPEALAARVAWRQRYRFSGWCSDGLFGARPADRDACSPGNFTFTQPDSDSPPPYILNPIRPPRPQPEPRPRPNYPG